MGPSAVGFLGRPRAPPVSVEACSHPPALALQKAFEIYAVSCWSHAPWLVFVLSAPASAACVGRSFRHSAPGAGSPCGTFLRQAAARAMSTMAITFVACHWRLVPRHVSGQRGFCTAIQANRFICIQLPC